MEFSLSYNPKPEYIETGYHTTWMIYKEDIIKMGFKPSKGDNDWLGEGVYFWDNMENAIWWKPNGTVFEKCIFICLLKCDYSRYLNLDDENEMNKFDEFGKKYIKEMSKANGKKPNFQNSNQIKKFFCDIYCKKNNFDILSFTFEHDIMNKVGFKIGVKKRRQICVREPKYISIMSTCKG